MVSSRRFKYQIDRLTYYRSLFHIAVFIAVGGVLYWLYDGGFVLAWYASFLVGITLLLSLSIPRYISLDERRLTINCLLDVTDIDIEDIVVIRKISPRKIGWALPLFGGNGFFGYYGHFFDFRHFRRFVIYATEWRYLVEIVDIYEDHYYVSCRNRDELIRLVSARVGVSKFR